MKANYLRSLNRAIARQAGWSLNEKDSLQPGETEVDDTQKVKAKKSAHSEPLIRWWVQPNKEPEVHDE